jgi:hypothetical protein
MLTNPKRNFVALLLFLKEFLYSNPEGYCEFQLGRHLSKPSHLSPRNLYFYELSLHCRGVYFFIFSNLDSLHQCSGSVTFWYGSGCGSGSSDPCL